MKKINIIYWITTGLILAMMLYSAIGTFIISPDQVKVTDTTGHSGPMMEMLGYKPYVLQMLAVAKILGIIAILVPGFPRLKEWAYAGFTFDLLGATISMIMSHFPVGQWVSMFIFIALLACSYIYHHKRLQLKASAPKDATV